MEINQQAPIVAAREIDVRAPLERVWALLSQIEDWPRWHGDIVRAELTGPLAVGTVFRWETEGYEISSTLAEIVPLRKLVWWGVTDDVLGVHVWTFSRTIEGAHVRTEESWEGESLPEETEDVQQALNESLQHWLLYLKGAAEAAAAPPQT